MAACTLYIIGAMMACASVDTAMLIAGRIVSGIGVGFAFSAPVYLAELAPSDIRGSLVCLFDLSIDFGILIGYIVGSVLELTIQNNVVKWRLMLGLAAILPLMVLIASPWLPESPRWLMANGSEDIARKVLKSSIPESPTQSEEVEKTLKEFHKEVVLEHEEGTVSWSDMCFIDHHTVRHSIGIVLVLGAAQQLNGSEALLYYMHYFLTNAGMRSQLSLSYGYCAVGLSKFIPGIIPILFADTYGRVPFMKVSVWGVALSLFMLTILNAASAPAVLSVVFMCLFFAFFSSGIAPLVWTVASEILPYRFRAKGLLLMVFVNRLASAFVDLTALSLVSALGVSGFFGLYTGLAIIAAISVTMVMYETKQETLESLAVAQLIDDDDHGSSMHEQVSVSVTNPAHTEPGL